MDKDSSKISQLSRACIAFCAFLVKRNGVAPVVVVVVVVFPGRAGVGTKSRGFPSDVLMRVVMCPPASFNFGNASRSSV